MTYDGDECKVYFEVKIVWRDNREFSTKLCVLLLESGKDGRMKKSIREARSSSKLHHASSEQCIHNIIQRVVD